jgi:serine/threonine protein kinase
VSPEQASGDRARIDHRTDIYSLGVMLYELLTLRRPFERSTTHQVLGTIIAEDPPDPRKFNALLPRDLVTVLLKAMEKDRESRYATAADFASDLRAFLAYKPISARPASFTTRAIKLARRHRGAVTAAALACVILITASIWWWRQPGYLSVTSVTEGATVYVDGIPRGATPLSPLPLKPGIHKVRLEKGDDLASPEEEVVVSRASNPSIDLCPAETESCISIRILREPTSRWFQRMAARSPFCIPRPRS